MGRIITVAVATGATLLASTAQPQETPGPSDTARYTFHRVQEQFLRLDAQTGQVSQCSWVSDGWFCRAVPDERAALESEIARLVASNTALKEGAFGAWPAAARRDQARPAGGQANRRRFVHLAE